MSSVGIRFSRVLYGFHWFSLRLANARWRDSNFVSSSLLTVAASLSCFVALVIVELSVNMKFPRSVLDSGALSRFSFGWCWVAGVNPMLCTREHWADRSE